MPRCYLITQTVWSTTPIIQTMASMRLTINQTVLSMLHRTVSLYLMKELKPSYSANRLVQFHIRELPFVTTDLASSAHTSALRTASLNFYINTLNIIETLIGPMSHEEVYISIRSGPSPRRKGSRYVPLNLYIYLLFTFLQDLGVQTGSWCGYIRSSW